MLLTAQLSLSDKKPPYFFKKNLHLLCLCVHIIYMGWPPCGGQMTSWGPEMGLRFSDLAAGASFLSTEPSQQSLVFIFIYF